jgi:membrane protein insertase Oxa1/YidC/SpoIIIJ
MTVANLGSAIFYVEDVARRRQAFALAIVFLVLLYGSPSGLVLYWTTNNVFSLLRTLVGRRLAKRLPESARLGLVRFANQE